MSVPLNILLIEDDFDDYILTQELLSEIELFSLNLHWEGGFQREVQHPQAIENRLDSHLT